MKFNCIANFKKYEAGYIIFEIKKMYQKNIEIFFEKLKKWQLKNNKIKDVKIEMEIHYKKRTLDQNALLWWLYGLLKIITGTDANELYQDDIYNYADRSKIEIKPEYLKYYQSEYRFIEKTVPIFSDQKVIRYHMTVIESSSHMNTIQLAKWCTMLINRIAENEIPDDYQAEIFHKLTQFQNNLNDQKIILYQDTTEEKYRKMHPLCEGCFDYISVHGQLAHIKSRGAGGTDEMYNRLHMCNKCHIETQHKKGWEYFKKLYPHLEYKINKALGETNENRN